MKYFFIIILFYFSSCKNKKENIVSNTTENRKIDTIVNTDKSSTEDTRKITKYFFDSTVSFDIIYLGEYGYHVTNGKYQNKVFFKDSINVGGFDSALIVDLNFDGKLDLDFRGSPGCRSGANYFHALFINKGNTMKFVNTEYDVLISKYKLDKNKKLIYSISSGAADHNFSTYKWEKDKLIKIKEERLEFLSDKDSMKYYNIDKNGNERLIEAAKSIEFPKEFEDIEIIH